MATTSKHMLVSVNLASMLGSKVVKEGLGVEERISVSALTSWLVRAAVFHEFDYDNDSKCFANPYPDALNKQKCSDLVSTIESIIGNKWLWREILLAVRATTTKCTRNSLLMRV